MFRSKMSTSSIQRPRIRTNDVRTIYVLIQSFICLIRFFLNSFMGLSRAYNIRSLQDVFRGCEASSITAMNLGCPRPRFMAITLGSNSTKIKFLGKLEGLTYRGCYAPIVILVNLTLIRFEGYGCWLRLATGAIRCLSLAERKVFKALKKFLKAN